MNRRFGDIFKTKKFCIIYEVLHYDHVIILYVIIFHVSNTLCSTDRMLYIITFKTLLKLHQYFLEITFQISSYLFKLQNDQIVENFQKKQYFSKSTLRIILVTMSI